MTDAEKLRRLEATLAVAGNTHTFADVVQGVKEGRFQWWGNGDGHVVSEILTFPRYKAVNYWLVFGALRECLSLEHEVNAFAVEQGCTMAFAAGRRGWGRAAAPTGWRLNGYQFIKTLVQR